jgi:multidrug efflux pump subunit AcrA (membrane-fusion protein)
MQNSQTINNAGLLLKKISWRRLFRSKWFYFFSLLLLVGAFYYYRQAGGSSAETRYILSAVAKGTVTNVISGTGQVSASNQIDIIPAASGDILELNVAAGQKVIAGEVIAKLDDTDAQSQVRQAKNSLASAQASLASKLAGPSAEEIIVSKKSIESSRMSYDNTVNNLVYTKQANADSLEKAKLQVENSNISLANAQRTYDNAISSSGISSDSDSNSLDKAYSDTKNTLTSAQISLRSALVNADNILEKNNYNNSGHNYKNYLGVRNAQSINTADNAYNVARGSFLSLVTDYSAAENSWNNEKIENLLVKTQETASLMRSLATAISDLLLNSITSADFNQSTLDSYKQTSSSQETTMISLLNSLQSMQQSLVNAKLNSSSSDISVNASVANAKASLESAKNNLISADNALKQAEIDNQKSLDSANNEIAAKKNSYESAQAQLDLKVAKPRSVELTSYYLQIATAEVNYQETLDNLEETEIKAPIDGIIAQVNKKAGDSVRDSDSGDTLATIITEEKLAVISLNEVDVARVAVGQKAILSFSALEDLEMTGTVVEIESIGTVSQGVVSYEVKIVLDSQDERIKPQMTVSADIIVEKSIDVLNIPNAAVKNDENGDAYVEVLDFKGELDPSGVSSTKEPVVFYVETGLSDDTNTEIKSGLDEGALVVVKITIASNSSSTTAKSSATSLLGGSGMGGMRSAGGPPGM